VPGRLITSSWRTLRPQATDLGIDLDADLELHPHDLRHHALTLAARKKGITTKELMVRAGHSSARAALIYQHAAAERDEEIADFIGDQFAAATEESETADIVALHR
jgi:integrase